MQKNSAQFLLILCVSVTFCFSQKEANNWYFGNGLGLDFTSGPPVLTTGSPLTSSLGCAAISNSTGALLFYTDGVTVWDKTHSVMANGAGLFGTAGAQTSVIVRKPGSSTLYYVFTVAGGGGAAGFNYSIVDMSLSAGNGSVVVKNASIYPFPCEEKISATVHCNQVDAWIAVRAMNTNDLKVVPLTAAGVGTIVTSNLPFFYPTSTASYTHIGFSPNGSLKFSHNGRKLASIYTVVSPTIAFNLGACTEIIFESYDFDNASGIASNYYWLSGFTAPFGNAFAYGTEWSPDGTKLYFTYHGHLMQVNMCQFPTILNGGIVGIGEQLPGTQWRSTLQSGPDGKIYVANPGANSMGVIHNPNNAGNNCNYQPIAIALGTNVCGRGLPNFYTPFFEKASTTFSSILLPSLSCNTYSFYSPVTCTLLNNFSIPFSGYVISNYNWNFGDLSSGSANTSTLSSPVHAFSSPGLYKVKLAVSYYCGRTDTIAHNITVAPGPTVTISTPSLSCGFTSATVNVAGGSGNLTYTWVPSANSSSVASLSPGIHTVTVKDQSTGCIASGTVDSMPVAISSSVNAPNVCAGVTVGSATSHVSLGSGNYTYSWSGTSITSSVVTGLLVGLHSVTVTDISNSCVLTNTFLISQSNPIQLAISPNKTGVLCTGDSVSLAALAVGTPPYQYFWSTGSTNASITTKHTSSGTFSYNLVIIDALNCTKAATYSLVYATTPTVTVNNATICAGHFATITATGANTFFWSPLNKTGTVALISPSATAVYTVAGITGNCAATRTFSVLVNSNPTLSLFSNAPLCAGNTLSLSASGASSFQWQGPGGFTSITGNPTIVSAAATAGGIYTVTGVDANSCTSTQLLAVKMYTVPNAQITGNSPVCAGLNLNLSISSPGILNWSGPAGFSSNNQQVGISNAQQHHSGLYVVQITTNDSCKVSGSYSVQVLPSPSLALTAPASACFGDKLNLSVNGAQSYSWSTGQSVASITVTAGANSSFSVTGYNSFGCPKTLYHSVAVSKCTGVAENENELGFILFPTPTHSSIRLQADKDLSFTIRTSLSVTLLSGVLEAGIPKDISVEEYASGVYFVEVSDKSISRIYKFVKQ